MTEIVIQKEVTEIVIFPETTEEIQVINNKEEKLTIEENILVEIVEVVNEVKTKEADLIKGENPVKLSNSSFKTLFNFVPETVEVFINGLKQSSLDFYTIGLNIINLSESMENNDQITVNYEVI